jgi:hypothetical protein
VLCCAVRCATYATHLGVASRRLRRVVPYEAKAEAGVRDLLAVALWLVFRAHLVGVGGWAFDCGRVVVVGVRVRVGVGAVGVGLGLGRSELTVIPNDWQRPPVPLASRGVPTVFVNCIGLNSLLSWRLSSLSPCMEALPAGGLLSLDDAGLCLGLSCELSPGLRNELCWTKDGLHRFSRCRKDLNTVRANLISLCADVGVPLLGLPALNESESSLGAMAAAIRLSLAAFSSTFTCSDRALIFAARLCDLTVALSICDAAPKPGEAAEAGEISDSLDDLPLRSGMIWSDTLPTVALIIDAASVGSVQCAPFTESSRSPTRRPPL